MKKISLIDAKRSTTMFPIDSEIEKTYDELVNKQVSKMIDSIKGIENYDGLVAFIKQDKDALEKLIALLGISNEKFKRVVSLVRLSKGFIFDTEWNSKRLRNEMLKNSKLMSEICELISNGAYSPQFQNFIPNFILEDFKINDDVVARLKNRDYLTKLIKSKVTTNYNGKCSNSYTEKLLMSIKSIAGDNGLVFDKLIRIPNTDITNVDAIAYEEKYIIINHHFSLTTSSGQSKYYTKTITPLWGKTGRVDAIIMINILDGAGWIGRNADYEKIYLSCDHFLNLQKINILDDIIKEHFKLQ